MPRGDRTGPEGEGPLTGRQMGDCAGYDVSGPGIGLGRGYGRGFGRGWAARGRRGYRNWFRATGAPRWARYAPPEAAAEMEQADLQAQASWLRSQLDAIQARLDALGSGEEGEA